MKNSVSRLTIFSLFLLCLVPACGGGQGPEVRDADGVPVLMENGMPYFTRFQHTNHTRLDLAGTWKFRPDADDKGEAGQWYGPDLDDSAWTDHPVPGSWNVQKPEWLNYVGAGWYRRKFIAPVNLKGRFNRLVLDGTAFQADAWLNGKKLGHHGGGFTQWSLDVSGALDYGKENTLTIRVDTRRGYDTLPPLVKKGRPFGWWPYGGINRTVMIESGPWTTLCKLTVDADHEGNVAGAGVVYNRSGADAVAYVMVVLHDLADTEEVRFFHGKVPVTAGGLASFNFERKIKGIKPWSPAEPNLYRVVALVTAQGGSEAQTVMIGFRKFEFRGAEAYLNGRNFFIRGVNRHEDDPVTGQVQTKERIEQDLALLKELHANYVRTAHYPDDPRWLDACDRAGILVETEIPLYQVGWGLRSLRAAEKSGLFHDSSRALIEMIERDRNHPSVVMWGVGDECFTLFPSIRRLYQRLIATARSFDPGRPVTFAIFTIPHGITPRFEISAGLADVIYLNEYLGWYFGKPEDVDHLLDQVHKKWPDKPVIVSEMGAGAEKGRPPGGKLYDVGYGSSRDFSEDYQQRFYQVQLPIIAGKPFVTGIVPWVFSDFRDDKRPDNPVPNMNLKGLLTYDRQKKQAFGVVADFYKEIERKGNDGG
ncbi:MAG TPA: glycoside hydrolase family 2 TIM barrel-domain containing protein [bacterium]|nr:glycoside hydrolase family 2 TIM barrel-domain containing protein [bacterium]